MAQQDAALARSRLTESLQLSRATGQRLAVARGLEAFAQLSACQGQHARAAKLAGAAQTFRSAIGAWSASGARLDKLLEPIRKQLGEQATNALLADGAAMTPEEAVRYATDPGEEAPPPAVPVVAGAVRSPAGSVLTPREWEISKLISRGLSNRAIADELVISPATAARHVANILTKLGFSSRAQVAAWATGRP